MPIAPFLITGLPRSRTAWFAVVAGALHEPSARHGIDDILDIWPEAGGGISDAGLGLHLERILRQVAPKTLIIERPLADVAASFGRYAGPLTPHQSLAVEVQLAELFDALSYEHALIKRVDYAELNSIETVRECLGWLGQYDHGGLDQLMHMNIQSDWQYNLDMADSA